jgi:formylglycine-generating enzyme required for sulfatase activity
MTKDILRILSPLCLLGCGTETSTKAFNVEPEVQIQSHGDGAEFQEGYEAEFIGMISDLNHDNDELLASWYVGEELACDWEPPDPMGNTACSIALSPEDSVVSVLVADPQNGSGRAEISVVVLPTQAPSAKLVFPVADGSYYSDQLITFKGMFSDEEDEAALLTGFWESNVEGALELNTTPDTSGEIEDFGYLSAGQHAISLHVEDTTGKTAAESVIITVGGPNNIPSCDITEPADSSAAVIGDMVVFRGLASDLDIPSTSLAIEWASDKDGSLGEGTVNSAGELSLPYADLSSDTHAITLRVADEVGAECFDSIIFSVGTPPHLTLSSPVDGEIYSLGDSIPFYAEISDPEDQPSEVSLEWSSDIDGSLSSQPSNSSGVAQFSKSTLSAGTHNLTVTAQDTTGLTSDAVVSFRVNTPPDMPSVSITPEPAETNDNLLASVGSSSDADGDVVTLAYLWMKNGVATSNTSASVPSGDTAKGELWTVRVTPHDGTTEGPFAEASITISNSAPSVSSVVVSPSQPMVADLLTCTASIQDADSESPTESYLWIRQSSGELLGTGSSLQLSSSLVSRGELIACEVTATDSDGATGTGSATATVLNTPPSLASVDIAPAGPNTDSMAVCTANATDGDGDALTLTYSWLNLATGASLGSGSAIQLDPSLVQPGIQLQCSATVDDSAGGTASGSALVFLANHDPSVSSMSLSPEAIPNEGSISCTADIEDLDGETPSITYTWTNLGTDEPLGTGSSLALTPASASGGDTIECSAMVEDAHGGSGVSSISFTVENTPPVIGAAAISPSSGVSVALDLECSAEATDADGGPLALSYIWTNGAETIGTEALLDLSSELAQPGDTVTCTASVADGAGASDSSTASVEIENSPPVVDSLEISPNPADNDDLLTCSADYGDPDGGPVSIEYTWSNVTAGEIIGDESTLLLGIDSATSSDSIQCAILLTDEEGATTADSVSIALSNSLPEVTGLEISSSDPTGYFTGSVISVEFGTYDANNDEVTVECEWYVDGVPTGETESTLDGAAHFDKGDEVNVVCIPDDGAAGVAVPSETVTISNSPPTEPGLVLLSPEDPLDGDDLECLAYGSGDDDPGDSIEYIYSWTVNGTPWEGATESGGTRIEAGDTSSSEVWSCSAEAWDGEESSISVESSEAVVGCWLTECDVSVDLGETLGADFSYIAPGTEPLDRYSLTSGFYMMTTAVTQEMYLILMDENPSFYTGTQSPVEVVTWHDAAIFANVLSELEELDECYDCSTGSCSLDAEYSTVYDCTGYRLPTEAEWEYAARSGAATDFWTPLGGGDILSGDSANCSANSMFLDDGTKLADLAWFCANEGAPEGDETTKPVALKLPNDWGLYDMSGNAMEWCHDGYQSIFPAIQGPDPVGSGSDRSQRGGTFKDNPFEITLDARNHADPSTKNSRTGFRLVRTEP